MQDQLSSIGKTLIVTGLVFILIGLFLILFPRIPLIGKLPGDILIKKEKFTFYFPIVTSIVLSLVLSLIFYLINKFKS